MSLVFFFGKVQESGLTESIPLICTSTIWGQQPAFLHLESPQGAVGGGYSGYSFDGHILCLLIGQVTLHPHFKAKGALLDIVFMIKRAGKYSNWQSSVCWSPHEATPGPTDLY